MSMAGYTKLFSTILASTIWRAPDKTRILWITMLAMADKHGVVEGSTPGLADMARISVDEALVALKELSSPDEYSRTKEHDGRRIAVIDGGWLILNHAKYREKMNADERREYLRAKQAESRARKRQQSVNNRSDSSTVSTHAEAEADAEASPKDIYAAYPKHVGRPVALKAISRALKKTGIGPGQLLALTNRYAASVKGSDPRFIPHPSTWFNQERFNDDPKTWEKNGTHRNSTTESNRNLGTANEGRSSQYAGVGKVR